MEGAPKFEQESNVESISDWKAAREAAPEAVNERLGFTLDSEPTEKKMVAMEALQSDLYEVMKENEVPGAFRLENYMLLEVGAQIEADKKTMREELSLVMQERSAMPAEIPADYYGVAMIPTEKQSLSPAANDNLPPQAFAA